MQLTCGMHWIFMAMRISTNIAEELKKFFSVNINFEESKLMRFFTCVYISDETCLLFTRLHI